MKSHLSYLHSKMSFYKENCKCHSIYLPTMFEYYSSIYLSKMLNRPFFMYKDFCKEKKLKNGFPITDKGVDLIDESSNIIGQCKYYSKNTSITYSKLSTFLATEKITGKKLDFYLIRTDDCKIDGLVKKMMDRKILNDVCISRDEFLFYIDDIDK